MKGIYMKNLNKEFGKLLQDGTLEYAPEAYNHNGVDYLHPTADDYKAVGYLPIIETAPSEPTPSGYHYEEDGWEVIDDVIHNKWKLVEDPYCPPEPRQFSKMKLVEALMKLGKWDDVKTWIESNGLYDLYLAAQNFAEDNDHFKQGVLILKDELQLTDEQVETILADCVLED